MAKRKWMQKVAEDIREKGTEGKLTRKAKRAGKSISEYCEGSHDATTARECNFAKMGRRASKRKASRRSSRR